jgi:hypothetical protein
MAQPANFPFWELSFPHSPIILSFKMVRHARLILVYFFLVGCVDPIEFVVNNNEPHLVVEGYISDKSYNETLLYPSDGRYFTIKLSLTSDVTNVRSVPVSGASVDLIDDLGAQRDYVETGNGMYALVDPDFRAVAGRKYKLKISLAGDDVYESAWESLPGIAADPISEIDFDEVEKQVYKYQADEKIIQTVKGITGFIQLPEHNSEEPVYYRWDLIPHWIFIAPLPPAFSPTKKCWATSPFYLSDYVLQEDYRGGYRKMLFFVETDQNERIYEDFSLLIRQKVLSREYYFFLKEMQEQNPDALRSDKPPFNLQTNLTALENKKKVIGYFAVVSEKARRWYFNRWDLSYPVADKLLSSCKGPPPFVPPPGCMSCLEYTNGVASNTEPAWWRE